MRGRAAGKRARPEEEGNGVGKELGGRRRSSAKQGVRGRSLAGGGGTLSQSKSSRKGEGRDEAHSQRWVGGVG